MTIRILPVSDLHCEHGDFNNFSAIEKMNPDVICLNGDIDSYKRPESILPFLKYANNVLMVLGNHDFWSNDPNVTTEVSKIQWNAIQYLINLEASRLGYPGRLKIFVDFDTIEINNCIFAGCTLWTKINPGDELLLKNATKDFTNIPNFTVSTWKNLHDQDYSKLYDFLMKKHGDKKIVVMTHYLPSFNSISKQYENNSGNVAYASNFDNLIAYSDVFLWMHGHTHNSCDYMLGNTRIVCNPNGYVGHRLNPNFDPCLIIEI